MQQAQQLLVLEGTESKIIANPEGNRITPSVVSFQKREKSCRWWCCKTSSSNKQILLSLSNPKMGTSEEFLQMEKNTLHKKSPGSHWTASILGYAEEYLWRKVTKAVITVPAYFVMLSVKQLKTLVKSTIWSRTYRQRPNCSSSAFGLDKTDIEENLSWYSDLGWHLIIRLVKACLQCIYQLGLCYNLDGDDFDQIIPITCVRFKEENSTLTCLLTRWQWRFERVRLERNKKDLSGVTSAQISLPFIAGEAEDLFTWKWLWLVRGYSDLTRDLVERRTKVPVPKQN